MATGENSGKPSSVQAPEQAGASHRRRKTEHGYPERYTEFNPEAGTDEAMKGSEMRYTVILERGETSWGAHVPDLPGCAAAAETREEALNLIRQAIDLHIQGLIEEGQPVPEPRSEGEVIEVGAA